MDTHKYKPSEKRAKSNEIWEMRLMKIGQVRGERKASIKSLSRFVNLLSCFRRVCFIFKWFDATELGK